MRKESCVSPSTSFSMMIWVWQYFLFFCLFIYFWERQTECEWGRGREGGRHRIPSRLQALSCQHRGRLGAWIYEPRDYDLSWSQTLNWPSHPEAPIIISTLNSKSGGRVPGWLGRLSVWLRFRSWSHGPWVWALRRPLCWQLRAWSLFQILCLPLSLTLPRSCSVSLCLKNKWTLKKVFLKMWEPWV